MNAGDAEGVSSAPPLGGSDPAAGTLRRTEIAVLMQEIERMQAKFAHRNNTGWVHACDALLGSCRKLLSGSEG